MKSNLKKEWKIILHGILIGILIHGFILANDLPNWDDLAQMHVDFVYMRRLGRWFLFVPTRLSSLLSITWLNGLLVIVYISISSYLVSKTIMLKNEVSRYLLLIMMLAFPVIGSVLFYTQYADGFAFALLLMSGAVYALNLQKKWSIILGSILTVLSLATYQAFFPFGCAVLVISLLRQLLDEMSSIKQIIKSAIIMLVSLGCSMVCYLILTKVFTRDILASYQGVENIGETSITKLFAGVITAYTDFAGFFISDNRALHGEKISVAIVTVFILSVIMIVWYILKQKIYKEKLKTLSILALVIIFPLSCNLIHLMGAERIHAQMIYGFVAAYAFAVFVIDLIIEKTDIHFNNVRNNLWVKLILCILVLSLGIIEYKYILNDNMVYYHAHVAYEQTYAYSERLVARIEDTENFSTEDKIVLIGVIDYDNEKTDTKWMSDPMYKAYTGIPAYLIQSYRMTMFMNKYLGSKSEFEWATKEYLEEIGALEIYNDMSNYPNDNSIVRLENGVILVRLSEL